MPKSFKIHLLFSLLYFLLIFFQFHNPYIIFILIIVHLVVIIIYEKQQQREVKEIMIQRKRYNDLHLLNKQLEEDFIKDNKNIMRLWNIDIKTYKFNEVGNISFNISHIIKEDDYIEQYKELFKKANPHLSEGYKSLAAMVKILP